MKAGDLYVIGICVVSILAICWAAYSGLTKPGKDDDDGQ